LEILATDLQAFNKDDVSTDGKWHHHLTTMLHLFTILPLLAGTLGNAILGLESLSTRGIGVLHW